MYIKKHIYSEKYFKYCECTQFGGLGILETTVDITARWSITLEQALIAPALKSEFGELTLQNQFHIWMDIDR